MSFLRGCIDSVMSLVLGRGGAPSVPTTVPTVPTVNVPDPSALPDVTTALPDATTALPDVTTALPDQVDVGEIAAAVTEGLVIPAEILEALQPYMEDEEVSGLLELAKNSVPLMMVLAMMFRELPIESFVEWVKWFYGKLERVLLGATQATILTEENKSILLDLYKGLTAEFPQDIVAELEENVKLPSGTFADVEAEAVEKFKSQGKVKVHVTAEDFSENHKALLAVKIYTMEKVKPKCYATVNGALRSLVSTDAGEKEKGETQLSKWKSFFNYLSLAVNSLAGVPQDGAAYRGEKLKFTDPSSFKPGDTLLWPAFTSTSTNPEVANSFGGTEILYSIRFPAEYGGFIKVFSQFEGEDELLLPSFSCFKIDNIRENHEGHRYVIEMTCLGHLSALSS